MPNIVFNLDDYYSYFNHPVPSTGSQEYLSTLAHASFIKNKISKRIGVIDLNTYTKRFSGNGTSTFQFNLQTVSDITQIEFSFDGYDFSYVVPTYTYVFDEEKQRIHRNPSYKESPDFDDLDINTNDPVTKWPVNDSDVEGNIRITYNLGFADWDSLPNWIKTPWIMAVKTYSEFMSIEPSGELPGPSGSAINYSVVDSILDRWFPSRKERIAVFVA